MDNQKPEQKVDLSSVTETVTPKKDHVIHQNEFHYVLKKGEPIKVNKRFIEALKTEKVI